MAKKDTKVEEKSVVVHTRLPMLVEKKLRLLVSEGYYSNVSDALRDAARKLVNDHSHVFSDRKADEKPKFELKEMKF